MYVESVKRISDRTLTPLLGIRCRSYQAFVSGDCCHQESQFAELGELTDRSARGLYYLTTGPQGDVVRPVNNATNCHLAQYLLSITQN